MNRTHMALSTVSRKRKIARLRSFIDARRIRTVLIVGAASSADGYGNMIERFLKERCQSVLVSGLEKQSPIWDGWVQADGRDLPFEDQAFDLVISNAVIEHVGGKADQLAFVNEHKRCGKNWYFTTPNRFFPVEVHSGVFFRHVFGTWVPPGTTRLLSHKDVRELTGHDAHIRLGFLAATLTAFGPSRDSS